MSDFQLRPPSLQLPRATGPSLGNYQLQLQPWFIEEFRALMSRPASARLRDLMFRPDWRQIQQEEFMRRLRQAPAAPQAPLVPAGAGPAEPRPGEVPDIMGAIWRVPAVQGAVGNVLSDVERNFGRMTTGETILVVSHAALLLGGIATAINLQRNPPRMPLSLLLGRSIPVPGVDGLSFQILHRGGQVAWENLFGSGVSVSGSARAVNDRFRGEVNITFDLHRIVEELR